MIQSYRKRRIRLFWLHLIDPVVRFICLLARGFSWLCGKAKFPLIAVQPLVNYRDGVHQSLILWRADGQVHNLGAGRYGSLPKGDEPPPPPEPDDDDEECDDFEEPTTLGELAEIAKDSTKVARLSSPPWVAKDNGVDAGAFAPRIFKDQGESVLNTKLKKTIADVEEALKPPRPFFSIHRIEEIGVDADQLTTLTPKQVKNLRGVIAILEGLKKDEGGVGAFYCEALDKAIFKVKDAITRSKRLKRKKAPKKPKKKPPAKRRARAKR